MLIKKIYGKESAKLLTVICLISLNIEKNCVQDSHVKQKNTASKYKNVLPINRKTLCSNLLIAQSILDLSNKQKQKAVSILEHCSNYDHRYEKDQERSRLKYLQRFKYKYQQCYSRSLKFEKSNRVETIDKCYLLAVMTLYWVYKILQTNSKFSACRKFKKRDVSASLF